MRSNLVKYLLLSIFIIFCGYIAVVDYVVGTTTKNQIYNNLKDIPKNKVGLLLGTSKFKDKAKKIINDYYQYRIDATVELYMAGKIDYIIVSGDNRTIYYNEPELMRADLIARGVPASKIILDNAGFRTLDSILRCKEVFGQTSFTIISQNFHNRRAVFIANNKEVHTIAFDARDGDSFWTAFVREKLARTRMLLDLLTNRQAKFYGETIEIK